MNLAPPIPRWDAPAASASARPRSSARPRTGSRPDADRVGRPARAPPGRLRDPRRGRRPDRDRHPDGLLVVGDRGYLANEDTFATVGPQIQWAVLGILAMVVMMRVDYRYLRLVSVPFYIVAVGLLLLVFVPQFNRVVGGSARWLQLRPLPAVHPAEIAKLAMVIYLAHWFAKRGTKDPRLLGAGRSRS